MSFGVRPGLFSFAIAIANVNTDIVVLFALPAGSFVRSSQKKKTKLTSFGAAQKNANLVGAFSLWFFLVFSRSVGVLFRAAIPLKSQFIRCCSISIGTGTGIVSEF